MNPYQGQGQYWRDVDPDSAMTKMEHHYWITKQSVFKKMGKKEDECVVASDAELDAKLELFKSIQDSCSELQKIIDRYQERICTLAQEENSMGRFLKEAGRTDKTRAGKMLINVGKSLSYSGQQHLALRTPLLRLYQEVETFRQRAISDTMSTLKTMEKQRTEYRAALSWMKDVSQELDPEKQLDKFRKVQAQVRRSKVRFDKSKLDCLQKVDLLAAARCNMFSHALVLYHNSIVQYCEKTTNAYQAILNTFKGYQHYDFCVIKELAEPSLKLAEQMGGTENSSEDPDSQKQEDKDILLFFDSEYHDDILEEKPKSIEIKKSTPATSSTTAEGKDSEQLVDLEILSMNNDLEDLSNNSIKLLGDIFSDKESEEKWQKEWEEVFSSKDSLSKSSFSDFLSQDLGDGDKTGENSNCLPSTLLNQLHLGNNSFLKDLEPDKAEGAVACEPATQNANPTKVSKKSKDMSSWYNLFADLDPLADPDAVGTKSQNLDRQC